MALLVIPGCAPTEKEVAGSPQLPAQSQSIPTTNTVEELSPIDIHVEKSQQAWVLPTDPFFSTGAQNTVLRRHIDSVLITRCMKDAGFTEFEEYTDSGAPLPENVAGDKILPMFNESLAAQYGYRRAPDPRITNQDKIIAAGGDLYAGASAEFYDQWDTCSAEAQRFVDERVNVASVSADDGQTAIQAQLNQLAVDPTSEDLVSAAQKWRECMEPLGIPDLPQQPWTMMERPPESLVRQWDWTAMGAPSAEEITVAIQDADCRRSSGWFDTTYELEWNMREEFVTQNQSVLMPILEEEKQLETQLRALLVELHSS